MQQTQRQQSQNISSEYRHPSEGHVLASVPVEYYQAKYRTNRLEVRIRESSPAFTEVMIFHKVFQ